MRGSKLVSLHYIFFHYHFESVSPPHFPAAAAVWPWGKCISPEKGEQLENAVVADIFFLRQMCEVVVTTTTKRTIIISIFAPAAGAPTFFVFLFFSVMQKFVWSASTSLLLLLLLYNKSFYTIY